MLDDWQATLARHTPPTDELLRAGQEVMGPAAAAGLVIFALTLLVLGKRAALFGGALAIVVGFGVANHFRHVFPWWPEPRTDAPPLAWQWLPLLFLVAYINGLIARVPSVPIWAGAWLRLGTGLLVAMILVPADIQAKWPVEIQHKCWPLIFFTLVVALGWAGSEFTARNAPGGSVALGLSISLFGAGFVLAHAHSARLADALSMPAAALVAVALIAFYAKVDVGGVVPGVAVLLPSIMLVGYTDTFSEIPWYAFALAAAPPLTIGLLAVPPVSNLTGFGRGLLFWALCLWPTVTAVVLATKAETLVTDW